MKRITECVNTIFFDIGGYIEISVFEISRVARNSNIQCTLFISHTLISQYPSVYDFFHLNKKGCFVV